MNPAALLRGAATYLRAHGWTKGQFFELLADTDQAFVPACASGAIITAAHGYCPHFGLLSLDADPTEEAAAAIAAMRVYANYLLDYCETEILDPQSIALAPSAIDVIGDWNDEKGRTFDEVIETLTDAAHDWEAAHPTGGVR
jgi:hypothetical protein